MADLLSRKVEKSRVFFAEYTTMILLGAKCCSGYL